MKLLFKKLFFVMALLSFFSGSTAWSRAGGAGGGGGRGGGGGFSHSSGYGFGGGYSSGRGFYDVGSSSSSGDDFLVFIILFAFVVIVVVQQMRKRRDFAISDNDLDSVDLSSRSSMGEMPDPEMTAKVRIAFSTIQQSWSQKRLDLMRRFVSDGVYQRFNAQFTMMNLLDLTDVMESVQIENISVADRSQDGNYNVMTLRISAYAEDQFISHKYPVLNSPGGGESFVEYWSFIRRKDYKKGFDLFHSENCPQCSAPLQAKLVETARCPFCGTYLNNGEYDWVLAEITQEDDYGDSFPFRMPPEIADRLPDFSKQLLEDRASNAFTQILIACATHQEAPLARFTSPQGFVRLQATMGETNVLFDRLFLNSVDAISCELNENICSVKVNVRFSYRRVQIQNNQAYIFDSEPVSETKSITLIRDVGQNAKPLGSIYANSCSHCGAPQKDSLSSVCAYCGQALNDPKTEWVVDQFE